ncbi:MAG: alpha/beta hydrolase [Bacteroidetes bacterium]|nr:alpha/beta hydrolase [Bacteroidota bacterium]
MEIFYKKSGRGWPVILIHGFCETHEIWDRFAEQLSKKFEIFVIDLPGFGSSPLPVRPFKISDIASGILDWIKQSRIQRPVVIGHSLGGYVGLAMAQQKPEIFSGLGLFQSTAYPDSEERKINRNRVIDFVKTHGIDPYIDTYVPGLFFDKGHPAIYTVDEIARKTKIESLIAYTEAMRDRESTIEVLKNFKSPFLMLAGEQDCVIPQEIAKELSTIAPRSTFCLLKNVGHMAMYESPQESLEAVEGFVSRIELNK